MSIGRGWISCNYIAKALGRFFKLSPLGMEHAEAVEIARGEVHLDRRSKMLKSFKRR